MIWYNWPKIFDITQGHAPSCMAIIRLLVNEETPKNKYDPMYFYSGINFGGPSFLLNPELLLYNAYKYTDRDLCIYISLASLRSYGEYIVSNTKTLPLIHSPVHPHQYLKDAKLLPVTKDDNIIFIYEEV